MKDGEKIGLGVIGGIAGGVAITAWGFNLHGKYESEQYADLQKARRIYLSTAYPNLTQDEGNEYIQMKIKTHQKRKLKNK